MKALRLGYIALLTAAIAPAWAATTPNFVTRYRFTGDADGFGPSSSLLNVNGVFYGTTEGGGGSSSSGTIFKYDPTTHTTTTLYSFNGYAHDGITPFGRLAYANGSLYGITMFGGTDPSESGTIFKFDLATSSETVLYSFGTQNGLPAGGLAYHNGYLYGTSQGDPWDQLSYGTVFKVEIATGAVSFLYNFSGGADGGVPFGDLSIVNGKLYGVATGGGAAGSGVIFKLDLTTNSETVLHSFGQGADGSDPTMGLTFHGGLFYGSTYGGGSASAGTVFKFDPATNTETVLYSFTGGADGDNPYGSNLLYLNGKLYGTAAHGGSAQGWPGHGVVFAIDASTGAETALHAFQGGKDGAWPYGLTLWNKRLIGSSTGEGIPSDFGTLFEAKP